MSIVETLITKLKYQKALGMDTSTKNQFVHLLPNVFLVTLLSLPDFALSLTTPGSQGEFCNGTIQPCDTSALLTCQDFTCQCILSDSMIFVTSRQIDTFSSIDGQCVSLVGESCGAITLELDELELNCVTNSFCNSQGECQCHPNHFKSEEGICLNQRGFGEECTNSHECSESLGLACVNKKCACNSTVSINSLKFFDDDNELEDGTQHRRCLGRPGQSCLGDGKHCVPNAVCKEEYIVAKLDGDIGDRIKVERTCVCEPGFEESKKKKVCVGLYNKTCDTQKNQFCRKDFSCMKGKCGCKNPADQIFDKKSQTCVSLLGGPCSSSGGCIPNAICRRLAANFDVNNNNQSIYEYCECGEGFVENMNRTCDVAYGQSCSQTLEGWKCDALSGLTCRDGFCACPDPGQTFDQTSMNCRSLAGSFCYRHVKNQCIHNAYCKPHRNGFLPFGHCECDEDYEMQPDRICG